MELETTAKALMPVKEIEQETASIVVAAKAMQVCDNETYVMAGSMLRTIKGAQRKVDEVFDPMIAAAFRAHKEACSTKKQFADPLVEAERILKGRIVDFDEEQERKRREEEAKLRELARKQEEDRLLLEAQACEDAGLHAEAEEIIAAPVIAPPILLTRATPKVEGLSTREHWTANVFDLMALVKAVASGQVPVVAIQANVTFLNQQARSLKELCKYPGVKIECRKIAASR